MHRGNILPSPPGKILVCYLPLGDPAMLPDMADIYVSCGADVLEVGFPAADPVLDGRWVRDSMARSLSDGMTPARWKARLSAIRRRFPRTYIVGMGYADLSRHVVGDDGEPLADAVLELAPALPAMEDKQARVAFVSTQLRADEVSAARATTAYVMLQANDGKTGLRRNLPVGNRARIGRLRQAGVTAPILLGIGVSTPPQAADAMAFGADGVVVGSACIDAAMRGRDELAGLVRELRAAVDG